MIVLDNDMTVFFDCDETLVLWFFPQEMLDKCIDFDNFGYKEKLLPHFKHIDQLKKHKARGHKIIVWSAGGYLWASEVVKVLKLEEYVDIVCCKPQFYYDDLTPQEFMPLSNRIYYDIEDKE